MKGACLPLNPPLCGTYPIAIDSHGYIRKNISNIFLTNVRNILIAAATILSLGGSAIATPIEREIVNPDELMVLVPHLEFLGYSRISTVEFCADIENISDWTNLITDSELLGMEACLIEHT